ncbi:MAG: bifunctional SulP family inorganic anion transporter/carbonic anhydrase [Deltaproteobacteria bacterium]|nr:bifunctional SulP family inorganic anion transporter/carbonic anhydrase [Deltaproteobacteria bacterium]
MQSPGAATLAADLTAGLVVFLVALPLCLGVALASNAPLFSGILAGIVGGLLVGSISHSHTSVSGPAAGLTAVVAAQIAAVGSFEAFALAVAIAGVIQIALGIAGAGGIADFIPSSVIRGLLGAIGLILILKQIPHLFGWDADPLGDMAFSQPDHENTFSALGNLFAGVHRGAALIGALCLALLVAWDRVKQLKTSPIPAPLVAALLGVGMHMLLSRLGAGWAIESDHLVQVPVATDLTGFLGFLKAPDLAALGNPKLYVAAITIALVASLETLLNLEAVDKIDPRRRTSPPNRELVAQGVGNLTAGLIGGLPVTSVIVRSSVNINSGGKTKLAAIVHGCLLLLCVALLPAWLNLIPLSALAAVLITTGYKLASPALFRQTWQAGFETFVPFMVTISAILLTDLLIGVLIGLAFSIAFILRSNFRRPLHRTLEKHLGGDVLHIDLANQVSFLNRAALRRALGEAPRGGHVLIDARATDYIDTDILSVIREYEKETAPARDVLVSLIGFKPHYEQIEDRVRYADFATRDLQEKLTPNQVVDILREGNERFQSGEVLTRDMAHLRQGVAERRHPLAAVLSGSSSRTPVEMIFDVGPGDIFCTRTTGNVAVPSTLGSLEYACAVAGAKVIVVLGHTNNKAVELALAPMLRQTTAGPNGDCPNLHPILDDIRQSLDPSWRVDWEHISKEARRGRIDQASRLHVQRTLRRIREQSPALARLAHAGRIKLVGGMYDVRTGAVELFE